MDKDRYGMVLLEGWNVICSSEPGFIECSSKQEAWALVNLLAKIRDEVKDKDER